MSDLVTVYAAIGHGNRAKAYDRGRQIGYSEIRGSQTNYYDASGRGLGYSEREGRDVLLRENGGRLVARYRTG
jgi:hypothetical protein